MRTFYVAVTACVAAALLTDCAAQTAEVPATMPSPATVYEPPTPVTTATPIPSPSCADNANWSTHQTASWLREQAIGEVGAVGNARLRAVTPAYLCKKVRIYADYFAVYNPHFGKHKGTYGWAFIAQRSANYTGQRGAIIKAPASVRQVCRNTLVVLHLGNARLRNNEAPVIYWNKSGALAFYSVVPKGKRAIYGDYVAAEGNGVLINRACA